jgi:hypothetical protein
MGICIRGEAKRAKLLAGLDAQHRFPQPEYERRPPPDILTGELLCLNGINVNRL